MLRGLDAETGNAASEGQTSGLSWESGRVEFTQTQTGVDVHVTLQDCIRERDYALVIHDGSSCDSPETQGDPWEPPRGEVSRTLKCGADQRLDVSWSRTAADDASKAWSVDGGDHDIAGRALILYMASGNMVGGNTRAACGVIQ
jgi:Cu/Zn superoxide dismutase